MAKKGAVARPKKAAELDKFTLSGSRTRVSIFLPVQEDRDAMAAMGVLRYLQSQLEAIPPIEGYTTSRLRPPVYLGAWYDQEDSVWCEEAVFQIVLDYRGDLDVGAKIKDALFKLRKKTAAVYKENGRDQKEFWIMMHPVVQVEKVRPIEK